MSERPRTGSGAFAALVRQTPLVRAPLLGDRVWLKLECLQRTGSFKLRGAARRLDALDGPERERGVVAASAGNHGLGVALAGAHLGLEVTVFVPASAPAVKRDGIARLGARVEVMGETYDEAETRARDHAALLEAVFVSPFDDDLVIRGNGGSLGDEIWHQLGEPPRIVCPVGGGGLLAGLVEELTPRGGSVCGVQPERNCAMYRSLEAGEALTGYDGETTLAEGCEGAVSERTFATCRQNGVPISLVGEQAIVDAVSFAYRRLGIVVEPTAAVALAGLRGAIGRSGTAPVVVVLTGGNIDPEVLDRCLAATRE